MIIRVILLLPMSLMKNKLGWVKFFVSQLPLNLIMPRDPPLIQNLQNLIRYFLLIIVRRKVFFIH